MDYKLTEGIYQVIDFDSVKAECLEFIKETTCIDYTSLKEVKRARTELRKKQAEIATLRKEASRAMLAKFQTQCRELEAMLGEADEDLRRIVNQGKEEKPTGTTISCVIYDGETLQKAVNFLEELGLKVKTKGAE